MNILVALMIFLSSTFGWSGMTATGPSAPTSEPAAIVLKGGKQEAGTTKRFSLQDGDYTFTLKGKTQDKDPYANLILHIVKYNDGGELDADYIANETVETRTYEWTTNFYDVEGGKYFMEFDLPRGSWTMTFEKQ